MFHFIFAVPLLKVQFEILDKELFSVSITLQEEITMAESAIRTQSSKLSNEDTEILYNTARHVPQNHITVVQQMDLDTSDTHFRDLSISKECKVLRLRAVDNVLMLS
jgi:hypothetical protein